MTQEKKKKEKAFSLSYYGGKKNMLRHLLPLMPQHELYCEPFIGGGALFWAKEKSKVEVINDLNGEVVNFYQVMKSQHDALNERVQQTLHSRELYEDARHIYARPHLFSELDRAWAFWVLTSQGFASKIGSWGYDKTSGSIERKIDNQRISIAAFCTERLARVQIENNDALQVIRSRDSKTAFFYLDPPYFNSNCGHYSGYSERDFENLLKLLTNLEGRWLMSSYDSDLLRLYTEENLWHKKAFEMNLAVCQRAEKKTKIEVLTANYPIHLN